MALSTEQVESFEESGFTLIDTPLDEEQLQQAERGWCAPHPQPLEGGALLLKGNPASGGLTELQLARSWPDT